MAQGQLGTLLSRLRHRLGGPADGDCTDRQLIGRFAASRDEAAFAALLHRHGPMVLGVCRRLLAHEQDAEDAFQATFLVLARRAGGLFWRDSLGGWLHEVACRVALQARCRAARRRRRERQVEDMPHPAADPGLPAGDLRPVIDEELRKLPEKLRLPVVLCYLEGRTNEEAARQLSWPRGTLSSRLAQARDLLRRRLSRRGVTLGATALTAGLAEAASAAVPAPLLDATLRAAVGAGGATGAAASLAEQVARGFLLARIKGVGFVLALAALAAGAALAMRPGEPPPEEPPMQQEQAAGPKEDRPRPAPEAAPAAEAAPRPAAGWAEAGEIPIDPATGGAWSAAIAPGGKLLAAGLGDGTVLLFDLATRKQAAALKGHAGHVLRVAFTADGRSLVSVCDEGEVKVWDVGRRRERASLGIEKTQLVWTALSPDGKLLAVATGSNKRAQVWELPDGTLLGETGAHDGQALGVSFLPAGRTLVTVGGDNRTLFWDAATRQISRAAEGHLRVDFERGETDFFLAFAPDHKTWASRHAGPKGVAVRLWDAATGKPRATLRGHDDDITWAAFAPDGRTLATAGRDGTVLLWDAAAGKRLAAITGLEFGGGPLAGAFAPDGRTFAVGGWGLKLWALGGPARKD